MKTANCLLLAVSICLVVTIMSGCSKENIQSTDAEFVMDCQREGIVCESLSECSSVCENQCLSFSSRQMKLKDSEGFTDKGKMMCSCVCEENL